MKMIIKAEILLLGTVLILKLWIMGLPPEYIFLQNWKKLEAKTKVCYVIAFDLIKIGHLKMISDHQFS